MRARRDQNNTTNATQPQLNKQIENKPTDGSSPLKLTERGDNVDINEVGEWGWLGEETVGQAVAVDATAMRLGRRLDYSHSTARSNSLAHSPAHSHSTQC